MSLLLSLIPWSKLAPLLGFGALIAGLFVRNKTQAIEAENKQASTAKAIVENHAVEQKAESAKTPEDVYAALEADRKSDHS